MDPRKDIDKISRAVDRFLERVPPRTRVIVASLIVVVVGWLVFVFSVIKSGALHSEEYVLLFLCAASLILIFICASFVRLIINYFAQRNVSKPFSPSARMKVELDRDYDEKVVKKLQKSSIRDLLTQGNVLGAESQARMEYAQTPGNNLAEAVNMYAAVLVEFQTREKSDEAWEVIRRFEPKRELNMSLLGRLGYNYWTLGETRRAVDVSMLCLNLVEAKGDLAAIAKIKNSLAYYFAELGQPDLEEKARKYIAEARAFRDTLNFKDTDGFIKIVYGKTLEEIREGIELCTDVYKQKPDDFLDVYKKHLMMAARRFELFKLGQV